MLLWSHGPDMPQNLQTARAKCQLESGLLPSPSYSSVMEKLSQFSGGVSRTVRRPLQSGEENGSFLWMMRQYIPCTTQTLSLCCVRQGALPESGEMLQPLNWRFRLQKVLFFFLSRAAAKLHLRKPLSACPVSVNATVRRLQAEPRALCSYTA